MQIPKRFKLLGHTIEVKEDPALMYARDWSGSAEFNKLEITLQPISAAFPVAKTTKEHVFLHEVVHHVLYHAGAVVNNELKTSLHKNEEFVDLLAGMLHQVLTTMEYDEVGTK